MALYTTHCIEIFPHHVQWIILVAWQVPRSRRRSVSFDGLWHEVNEAKETDESRGGFHEILTNKWGESNGTENCHQFHFNCLLFLASFRILWTEKYSGWMSELYELLLWIDDAMEMVGNFFLLISWKLMNVKWKIHLTHFPGLTLTHRSYNSIVDNLWQLLVT